MGTSDIERFSSNGVVVLGPFSYYIVFETLHYKKSDFDLRQIPDSPPKKRKKNCHFGRSVL